MTIKEAIDVSSAQAHASDQPMALLVADLTGEPVDDIAKFVAITLDYLRGGGLEVPTPEDGDPANLPENVRERLAHVCTALVGAMQLGFNLGQAKAAEMIGDLDADLSDLGDAPETA